MSAAKQQAMSGLRRLRAHGGVWTLIALIAAGVVFTVTATPRTVNGIADAALRRMITNAPPGIRDLTFVQDTPDLDRIGRLGATAKGFREAVTGALPDLLPETIGASWSSIATARAELTGAGVSTEPDGLNPRVSLAHQPDLEPAMEITSGRLPRNEPPAADEHEPTGRTLEVMASAGIAETLRLRVGEAYEVQAQGGPRAIIRLVGVYTARDASAADWVADPTLLRTGTEIVRGPGGLSYTRTTGTLLTDAGGAMQLRTSAVLWRMSTTARFRLDERSFHSGQAGQVRDAVRKLHGLPVLQAQDVTVITELDELIATFTAELAAVRALLAVVGAGIVGTAAGLLFLAARLAVDRRRPELRLIRARGASVRRVAGTLGIEGTALILPAVVAGWSVARLVPGRSEPTGLTPLLAPLLATVVAVAAVPVAAAVTSMDRRGYALRRRDVVLLRPGPRRLTAEVTVLGLAVLGVVLVHRRGLALEGIDPYLSTVPVLAGVAAGMVALRLYPWPVRVLGRLTRRRRGATAFLGLARAGRRGTALALPLVVLVLAIALGAFAGAVRAGIDGARRVATTTEVGADFRLTATAFPAAVVGAVRAVPGVVAVAAVRRVPSRTLVVDGAEQPESGVLVLAADPAAYRRILAAHELDGQVPSRFVDPGGGGAVPVLASPALAERLSADTTLGGRPIRLAGTTARLPGLDRGRDEFLLAPLAAAGQEADAPITILLVNGRTADPGALSRAAVPEVGSPAELTSLAERTRTLATVDFNEAVALAFAVGLVAAVVAGLLAVGLALAIEARTRGQVLSLLRTMGLPARQARVILLIEVTPMMATAVLAGAAVGVALPVLLAPALGLSAFTAGVPLRMQVDSVTAGLLAGLFAVLLAGAVLTEAAVNRRLGLGQVLRVGAD